MEAFNLEHQEHLLIGNDYRPRSPLQKMGGNALAIHLLLALVLLAALRNTNPQHSYSTFKVGCAIPDPKYRDLTGFLHATRISASRGTRIVLWPETAVSLASEKELLHLNSQVHGIAQTYGTHIGVTYNIPMGSKMANSFALIGPNSPHPITTYMKHHLLPLVESFPTQTGPHAAPVSELQVTTSKRKSKHSFETGTVMVSTQICHDTSFPFFSDNQSP